MKKKIIIDVPFNTIPSFNKLNKYRSFTKEWIDNRINIFMKYTASSIINQTDQNFLCVFHYEKTTEEIVKNEFLKYPKLPDNIVVTSQGDDLILNSIKGYDYIYRLRLDSDNVIHPTFIEQLNKEDWDEETECIIGRCGYLYDVATNRLALWDHNSSAFNTYISKVEDYTNINYRPSINIQTHHLDITDYRYQFLYANNNNGRSYIIIVHGGNLANHFDQILYEAGQWCSGMVMDEALKAEVLKGFKIL